MKRKIAIIGGGNLGKSIAQGLVEHQYAASELQLQEIELPC